MNSIPSIIDVDKREKRLLIEFHIDNDDCFWGNDTNLSDMDSLSEESTVRFYKIFRDENNI